MKSILVTGANGFVGRALCEHLSLIGRQVKCAVRNATASNEVEMGNIGSKSSHQSALSGCDAVVHLAARVHVMHDTTSDPLDAFREVNTYGALNLARQAAQVGVRRFVFLSSAKVNGESGEFFDEDEPHPQDNYAVSKWEAELGLREIGRETGMEVIILRPPLVYGPGVAANFLRLMRTVNRGLPLPFGAIKNRRSLIYLGNLVAAIVQCLDHPVAVGKTYLVSDAEDVSTPMLITKLANALDCSPRLLAIPPVALRLFGGLLGKGQEIDRLLGSLAVDCSAIRHDLGWIPPYAMDEGLFATASWFRQHYSV
jgi:nucleoside-diphosphate-sugar epimerase